MTQIWLLYPETNYPALFRCSSSVQGVIMFPISVAWARLLLLTPFVNLHKWKPITRYTVRKDKRVVSLIRVPHWNYVL